MKITATLGISVLLSLRTMAAENVHDPLPDRLAQKAMSYAKARRSAAEAAFLAPWTGRHQWMRDGEEYFVVLTPFAQLCCLARENRWYDTTSLGECVKAAESLLGAHVVVAARYATIANVGDPPDRWWRQNYDQGWLALSDGEKTLHLRAVQGTERHSLAFRTSGFGKYWRDIASREFEFEIPKTLPKKVITIFEVRKEGVTPGNGVFARFTFHRDEFMRPAE